ncbi:Lem3/Cdc50 [Aulographum hederae CBS 113979]|uniref:Lem3/Cdc50 n=1 Tax=Aulographum hederae CBS 113979 TaxID=1176131 RepID=A0A6G1GN71_9PEZI|nr:Lem3/Cdc50 [Aulographum hederae CBS 113979]
MSQTRTMDESESIEAENPNTEEPKKQKSRRPANTAFRQQRLKAWQPILTPRTVLPLFFVVGIIFAPIGGALLYASSLVEEISIDYSHCYDEANNDTFTDIPSNYVNSYFKSSNYTAQQPAQWSKFDENVTYQDVPTPTRWCQLEFDITNDIGPPVLFYYRLTNFYQNHRRYVKSFDQQQLEGDFRTNGSISTSDCDPLRLDNNTGKAYYPCGLIANSLFNDTFSSPLQMNAPTTSGNFTYDMSQTGIAWGSDKELYKQSAYTPYDVSPPPNWQLRYPKGYEFDNALPDLHNDEAFQVWMRTAGLPTFSKLAQRNDDVVMKAGRYRVLIQDNFPVLRYGGTKAILISTRTVMGGKNSFLGIAYIVVGGLCIALGALFTAASVLKPRKLGDHTYLTWNNEPSTATTTGRSARPNEAA